MGKIEKTLALMSRAPQNVRFSDLAQVCEHYFGAPRNSGSSHFVFRTPWIGDPRVNIQKSKDGLAKAYQVKQVLSAIRRVEENKND